MDIVTDMLLEEVELADELWLAEFDASGGCAMTATQICKIQRTRKRHEAMTGSVYFIK